MMVVWEWRRFDGDVEISISHVQRIIIGSVSLSLSKKAARLAAMK